MPAPEPTAEAQLAAVLAEWNHHRDAINEAVKALDFATVRVLEEQEVGWLNDIAAAAETLLEGRLLLQIRVTNTYATGTSFTHDLDVVVDEPADDQDPDEWAQGHLLDFTGEGPAFAAIEGLYEVEVIACASRPDLVGAAASAQG